MHICLIMDNPETPHHPVIAETLQMLKAKHTVRLLDVHALSALQALEQEHKQPRADLYLLKSHASQALELAHALEQDGRQVINSWSASRDCQDRLRMSMRLRSAQLPWPDTWSFASLAEILDDAALLKSLPWPLIIKSRYSQRDDLVEKLEHSSQLRTLTARWSKEPVILQECLINDGWDSKLWVIDQQIFAARRRTPLEAGASKQDVPIAENELPNSWRELALAIGHAFKMPLYGVDLLITEKGPYIVDVNAFPGFRGVPGAREALVDLVEKLLQKGAERL
jgi:ribosomal protein S6--L-glutamate ligase